MDNLRRLAAAPSESLVAVHGVITRVSRDVYPRTLTISDESGSVAVEVPSNAVGGLVVNNGSAWLIGTRATALGLRVDGDHVRASNIDLDAVPPTVAGLVAAVAHGSTGAALPAAALLALPAEESTAELQDR
ncbi:hypothetical protein ACIQF6_33885 [Kitasatospora sp. NPDC092948]|uniref:hypothetical protein n=1 Tax=Kitasatospora sp. NPDC092948 TaxID=3364088 RepID=UPI003828094E